MKKLQLEPGWLDRNTESAKAATATPQQVIELRAGIERLRAALSDIEEARFWKFPNEQAKNAHNSVTPDEMRKHLWEWSRSRARAALSGKTEDSRG